jgi:excisionase family DNA binding protein
MTELERMALTVAETASLFGLARNSACEAIRRGELPAVRIGRRILVPRPALEKMISGGDNR